MNYCQGANEATKALDKTAERAAAGRRHTTMSEGRDGRSAILGNLGDVFMPRNKQAQPPRFDLTKCQYYESGFVE